MSAPLLIRTDIPLAAGIAEALRPHIGTFVADGASVIDQEGVNAEPFSVVIHAGPAGQSAVPIDSVALVIACYEDLTVDAIREAYRRSASVRSFDKQQQPKGAENNTEMTMVIVVGKQSELPLELIAEEIKACNAAYPSSGWPDVFAVLGQGIVNYTARVPGREQSGDFLLPSRETIAVGPAPSTDIELVIRPMGELTFNKVTSFAMLRVVLFDPKSGIKDFNPLVANIPNHGVSIQHYQFTTKNQLSPVSKQREIQARLSLKVFNITSGKKALGSIQYRPWQDGGVLIVRGRFPIDVFLMFLGEVVPALPAESMQYFQGEDMQVSYVLPVSEAEFHKALALFEQRSNIYIRPETSKVLVQQLGNEGTSTPFIARLMMGVMGIRDAVYEKPSERLSFDEYYEPVLSNLRSAREASKEIARIWEEHVKKVTSGEIVDLNGRTVRLREHIDRPLKREIEGFVNSSARAIKNGLQTLTGTLGLDVGFLFGKEAKFQAGIAKTREANVRLADYLLAARNWCEPLMLTRNNLEHTNVSSVRVVYNVESTPVVASEPTFEGYLITQYTSHFLDRVSCFVEDMVALSLRGRLPQGLELTEIPLDARDPVAPERFRLTVSPGGLPAWELQPNVRSFDET